MAQITSIQKKSRTSSGWGGWSGLSGVDYVNNNGLYVVYGVGLSMSAGEQLTSLSISTNFVAPQSSNNPSTATCYLYASDPTGSSSPPGGMMASASMSFNASASGTYLTFNLSGFSIPATSMVYVWFTCTTTYASYGSNQIYHYSTGNGYTYAPAAYIGTTGGSSGGGEGGDTGGGGTIPGGGAIGGPTTGDGKLYLLNFHTDGIEGIKSTEGDGHWYIETWLEIDIELEYGYEFKGWYEYDASAEGGYGDLITTDSWMTHIVTGDWDIIPKVTKVGGGARKVKVFINSLVNASTLKYRYRTKDMSYTEYQPLSEPYELELYDGTILEIYAETGYYTPPSGPIYQYHRAYFQTYDVFSNGVITTYKSQNTYAYFDIIINGDTTIVLKGIYNNTSKYDVTVSAWPGVSSVSGGGQGITQHDVCLLYAEIQEGYRFTGWYVGNQLVSTDNPHPVEVTANTSYIARTAEEIIVTAECGEGIISVTGTGAYIEGEQCTLLANVAYGYEFWGFSSGTATNLFHSFSNPYIFTVRPNALVPYTTARAKIKSFKIVVKNSVEGTSYTYSAVFNTSFTANTTVRAGYEFLGWSIDGAIVSTELPFTFTVNGDVTLVAVITPMIYTVTPVAGEGITSVSGGGNYPHGSSCTIYATPAERYILDGWFYNGIRKSTTTPYTFSVTYSNFGNNKNLVYEARGYLKYLIGTAYVWMNGAWRKVNPYVWLENTWKKLKTIIYRG